MRKGGGRMGGGMVGGKGGRWYRRGGSALGWKPSSQISWLVEGEQIATREK